MLYRRWEKLIGLIHLFLVLCFNETAGLHLTGTFRTGEFFKFLTRFGIQATDMHDVYATRGYIYGNITLHGQPDRPVAHGSQIMLTVMDVNYFSDYYQRRRIIPRSMACPMMFQKIEKVAYFFECNENGTQDFIRRVPCPLNGVCVDEDNINNVINGFQFTFKIQDTNQPRFWYISLVSCVRDKCSWDYLMDRARSSTTSITTAPSNTSATIKYESVEETSLDSYTISYDIWLVNGSPGSKSRNPFEHQFTYELHDVFEIYLCSFFIYMFILPFIIYRLHHHFHYLYFQLLVCVSFELASRLFSLFHWLIFSFDGRGIHFFQLMSEFLESIGSSILILILISVARGWTVRSKKLRLTRRSYIVGFFLQAVLVISHMIALTTIDPVYNTNSYETVAGYVELGVRFLFMFWFLIELKETSQHLESVAARNTDTGIQSSLNEQTKKNNQLESENEFDDDDDDYEIENNGKKYKSLNPNNRPTSSTTSNANFYENYTRDERLKKYQKFYLHYGACSLVWFINLPVIIFVTSFVSELFRARLLLSIRFFVNFLSVVSLFYIIWSPKTPLKLPGKKSPIKYEINNLNYLIKELNEDSNNDDNDYDENDEDIIYLSTDRQSNTITSTL